MHQRTPKLASSILWILLLIILVTIFLMVHSYSEKNIQVINIDKVSGPLVNPLMGWAPWATIQDIHQPHTLVYAGLTWREFEPQEGYYDFDTFERKQNLTYWRETGNRVVFRFVMDVPGHETHLDIPDWLFNKMHGSGEYYENEYGKGFSPDYSNPILIDCHKKAIDALGSRYGKDEFFAFIELGSLGHWGEWHARSGISPFPPEKIRDLYVSHYVEAFPGAHLLMRRPFSIAQKLRLGLYNDMTADPSHTDAWLDWIENGGEYLGELNALAPMPNAWEIAPIGGEQSPALSNEQIYGTNLEKTLQLLKESHTTFIGPNSPAQLENGNPLQVGIDQVLSTIGYRLYLDHVQMPRWVLYGSSIQITLTFSNSGIAPIYYNWPTRLYLLDARGNTLTAYEVPIDLRNVLPGEFHDVAVEIPVGNLKNGIYSFGIAIIDPVTGRPAVQLANENIRPDLIQFIGSFEIKRLFNHD